MALSSWSMACMVGRRGKGLDISACKVATFWEKGKAAGKNIFAGAVFGKRLTFAPMKRSTKNPQQRAGQRIGKSKPAKAQNQRNRVVEKAKQTGFRITPDGHFVREAR